jgi:hypothetical protein
MTTDQIIALARQHLDGAIQESSARFCLADAIALRDDGDLEAAARRAVRSLAYSVGVLHADYQRAAAAAMGALARRQAS